MTMTQISSVTLCVLCIALCALQAGCETENHKVIIVGAGAAGLAAAGKLSENNVTDFIILEAKNRTGGRICTAKFGDHKIDLGPQYVHGKEDNVVYDLVKTFNVLEESGSLLMSPDIIVGPGGVRFNKSLHEEIDNFDTNGNHSGVISDTGGSYGNYVMPRLKAFLNEKNYGKSESEIIMDAVRKVEGVYRGAEMEEIGAKGLSDYVESSDNTVMFWKEGYETFTKILMGKYGRQKDLNIFEKIYLNKEVEEIHWGDNGVDMNCTDGTSYHAEKVIVTFPLGVLKQLPFQFFSPRLPIKKKEAIYSLGNGLMEYVNLKFDSKWWPEDFIGVDFGMTKQMKNEYKNGSSFGMWPTSIAGFYTVPNAPLVIQALIYGKAVKDMESFSDEDVKTACYHMLQWIFGNSTYNIPKPSDIIRSHWNSDQYIKGSFSFRSVESDIRNITGLNLGKPLLNSKKEPIVFFAGEATDLNFYSTVNGAVRSGWREAKRVLKYLNK